MLNLFFSTLSGALRFVDPSNLSSVKASESRRFGIFLTSGTRFIIDSPWGWLCVTHLAFIIYFYTSVYTVYIYIYNIQCIYIHTRYIYNNNMCSVTLVLVLVFMFHSFITSWLGWATCSPWASVEPFFWWPARERERERESLIHHLST